MSGCSIRILPPDVANKIAAGEVIERPSSVVKELVENSIDAGATKIIVALEDGGKGLIKVIDDGIGMTKEELRLSIERHATSKIRDIKDIECIRTLGFRGEALPSILAVSKLRIKSKKKGAEDAWQLISDFGQNIRIEPASITAGTTIEVSALFDNLPARKKFLKSTQVEFQHNLSLIKIFSVCYHELEFKLYHQNKLVFSSQPTGFDIELVSPLFGEGYTHFFTHEEDFGDVRFKLVLSTHEDLIGQKGLHYFLNRRLINGRLFSKVISDATKSSLGREFCPAGVIFIECPPQYYDVNVHPSKMEVKFHKSADIFRKLFLSIKNALQKHTNKKISLVPNYTNKIELDQQSNDWKDVLNYLYNRDNVINPRDDVNEKERFKEDRDVLKINKILLDPKETLGQSALINDVHKSKSPAHDYVKILGQVSGSFILIETNQGLSIIDQHALHEAILFSDLLEYYKKNESYPSQLLLFPEVVSIGEEQTENFLQRKGDLEKLGLKMEIFGHDELIIRAIPLVRFLNVKDVDFREFLNKILGSPVNDRAVFIHNAISVISCDLAVKSGISLNYEEMRWLVDTMFEKGITNCPHGRPVMFTISFKEIRSHLGKR